MGRFFSSISFHYLQLWYIAGNTKDFEHYIYDDDCEFSKILFRLWFFSITLRFVVEFSVLTKWGVMLTKVNKNIYKYYWFVAIICRKFEKTLGNKISFNIFSIVFSRMPPLIMHSWIQSGYVTENLCIEK